jgi:hypothetical protein
MGDFNRLTPGAHSSAVSYVVKGATKGGGQGGEGMKG